MIFYLFKRGLLAIFVLAVISLATFGMSRMVPGDLVDFSKKNFGHAQFSIEDPAKIEQQYARDARELHLDRPVFYFTLTTAIYPDTFFKILHRDRRQTLAALLERSGNWTRVQDYSEALREAVFLLEKMPDSLGLDEKTALRKNVQNLQTTSTIGDILLILDENQTIFAKNPTLSTPFFEKLQSTADALKTEKPGLKSWLPTFYWHGSDNQYHHWLSGFLFGEGEKSWIATDKFASERIAEALPITLALTGAGLFLSYFLAIPLGVFSARRAGSRTDRWLQNGLLAIWSMPIFWLASLAVVFLTSSSHGFKLFPGIGLGDLPENSPFWPRFFEKASHLLLPILLITIHVLALLTRQMRGSVLQQMPELYIRTARAKGLPESRVFWKHALPNALFPLITIFGSLLPASIAGSVVIEVIFQIPGMGQLVLNSFQNNDWPVVFYVIQFSALLTVAGSLVADLLYAWADPRVRF